MEQIILISVQAYFLYYIATNVYLVLSYIRNADEFRWEEVAWLLVFGFVLTVFLGIEELRNNWREW